MGLDDIAGCDVVRDHRRPLDADGVGQRPHGDSGPVLARGAFLGAGVDQFRLAACPAAQRGGRGSGVLTRPSSPGEWLDGDLRFPSAATGRWAPGTSTSRRSWST